MSKMSRRMADSLEDDIERIFKRVKKLGKKFHVRNGANDSEGVFLALTNEQLPPVATEDEEPYVAFDQNPPIPNDYLFPENSDQSMQEPDEIERAKIRTTNQGTYTEKDDASNTVNAPNIIEFMENTELDDDILEILGDDPSSAAKLGPDIRKEVASRFQHIAVEGLSKESRKELMKKYLLPANCLLIGAPSINPEIKAALTENFIKRDKGIETKQKEMATAISGVTELIAMHLASKQKNNVFLQKLMDVGRILCDIQHGNSVTRRNFLLYSVKNYLQKYLKNTTIDTLLFGAHLPETLKTARAVTKFGADLKADSSKAAPPRKATKPSVTPALNWKAAPSHRSFGAVQQAPRTLE